MAMIFSGALRDWKFVLGFIAFSIVFWLVQFAYHFHVFTQGDVELSLIRAFAFSGGTFIAGALLSSVVFRFQPQYAKYWTVRRALGVTGFVFGAMHVMVVTNFLFGGDPLLPYGPGLNPLENPLVFGAIAYTVFFVMTLTSTDWATRKLGKGWKPIHRLVYLGFWALVSHFLLVNPPALMNLSGYLLLTVTFLALAGELFWFIKIRAQRNFSGTDTLVGIFVIFLYLLTIYFGFVAPALMK